MALSNEYLFKDSLHFHELLRPLHVDGFRHLVKLKMTSAHSGVPIQVGSHLQLQAAKPIQGCFNFLFEVSQQFAIFLKSLFQQKKLQQKNESTNKNQLVIIPTSSAVSPPESSWSKLPVGNQRIKAKIDASCRSLFAFCRIGIYWHHKCNCGIFYCNHQVLESRTVEETIQRPLQENCSCRKPVLIVVYGTRLIRRPCKGCRKCRVPKIKSWKGCRFSK